MGSVCSAGRSWEATEPLWLHCGLEPPVTEWGCLGNTRGSVCESTLRNCKCFSHVNCNQTTELFKGAMLNFFWWTHTGQVILTCDRLYSPAGQTPRALCCNSSHPSGSREEWPRPLSGAGGRSLCLLGRISSAPPSPL